MTANFLLTRNLGSLRDDVANDFEALFITARRLLDVFGEHPQHRGLELNERLGHVEPDRTVFAAASTVSRRNYCQIFPWPLIQIGVQEPPRPLRSSAAIEKADLPAACSFRRLIGGGFCFAHAAPS